MRAVINAIVSFTNNSQFVFNYTAKQDDGTVIVTENMSINHPETDVQKAKAYVKASIKSRAEQILAETDSVTKPELQKIIGQEFNV